MRLNEFPSAEQQSQPKGVKAGAVISEAFKYASLEYMNFYSAERKLEKALETKRSMQDTHGEVMVLTALTRVMVEQNQLESARDYIEMAYHLNREDPRTLRAYGIVLYKMRHDLRGDAMMERSLKLTPADRQDMADYTQKIWDSLRTQDQLADSPDPKVVKSVKKAQKTAPRWPMPL